MVKTCGAVYKFNFVPRQIELETVNTASFSEFFKHFPELSVKYSRFVIESLQVNY